MSGQISVIATAWLNMPAHMSICPYLLPACSISCSTDEEPRVPVPQLDFSHLPQPQPVQRTESQALSEDYISSSCDSWPSSEMEELEEEEEYEEDEESEEGDEAEAKLPYPMTPVSIQFEPQTPHTRSTFMHTQSTFYETPEAAAWRRKYSMGQTVDSVPFGQGTMTPSSKDKMYDYGKVLPVPVFCLSYFNPSISPDLVPLLVTVHHHRHTKINPCQPPAV